MAAAMPMAGAPRTRRLRMASQTSSTVRQSLYWRADGRSVWSRRRTKPPLSPTHWMVRGAWVKLRALGQARGESQSPLWPERSGDSLPLLDDLFMVVEGTAEDKRGPSAGGPHFRLLTGCRMDSVLTKEYNDGTRSKHAKAKTGSIPEGHQGAV